MCCRKPLKSEMASLIDIWRIYILNHREYLAGCDIGRAAGILYNKLVEQFRISAQQASEVKQIPLPAYLSFMRQVAHTTISGRRPEFQPVWT